MPTISPLKRADACALGLLHGLDGSDPERDRALRAAVGEVRRRIRVVARYRSRVALMLVSFVPAVAAGAVLGDVAPWGWRVPLVMVAFVVCAWPLFGGWWRPVSRRSGPAATGTPEELADELMGTLQGAGILAGRRRPLIAHAEAAAARAWSIVHGGPPLAADMPKPGPWQPRWSRQAAQEVENLGGRMHDLVHRTCIDAAAADDPDEVLHRLARYATVNERLIAARMALQGRTPWWARAGYPAMLAVYVGIVSAWKPGMTSLVIGSLSGVIVAQLVRTPNECKVVGMPSVGHADISAGVVAGIDQSSTALADLAQTPAVVAARAELTAAREILASAYNSST